MRCFGDVVLDNGMNGRVQHIYDAVTRGVNNE